MLKFIIIEMADNDFVKSFCNFLLSGFYNRYYLCLKAGESFRVNKQSNNAKILTDGKDFLSEFSLKKKNTKKSKQTKLGNRSKLIQKKQRLRNRGVKVSKDSKYSGRKRKGF